MENSSECAIDKRVTIAIVPREKFSVAADSLKSILANIPSGVPLVYVDCSTDPLIATTLEQAAPVNPSTYIHVKQFLTPNVARNLAFSHVTTPYVVFIDNDVFVEALWLEHLVAYADETGAAIVGPLTLINVKGKSSVHLTGGTARIIEENGVRRCIEQQRDAGAAIAEGQLRASGKTDVAEFHTMLVRSDFLTRTGPLDERLRSVNEHVDLCLIAAEHGEQVMYCNKSIISYFATDQLTAADRAYYRVRWSEIWNITSARHFARKWHLDPKDSALVIGFARVQRLRGLRMARGTSGRADQARQERLQRALERVTNILHVAFSSSFIVGSGRKAHVHRFTGPDESPTLRAATAASI